MLKEKDLDIVLIATPDHWHALPMIAAVEAGRRRLRAEADQRRRGRGPGDARRGAQAQARRPGRHAAPQHAAPDRGPRPDHQARASSARSAWSRSTATTTCAPTSNPPDTAPPENLDYEMWTGPAPMRPYNPLVHPRELAGVHGIRQRHRGRHVHPHARHGALDARPRLAEARSLRPAASSSTRRARRTSPTRRPPPSTSATCNVVWQHRTWGDAPDPKYPWGATFYGDKGTLKASVMSYDFMPVGQGRQPIHEDVTYELEQYPEDKTEKDLEKHVAPAIRGHMKDFLAAIDIARQAGRRHRAGPHLDRRLHPGQHLDAARPVADLGPRQGGRRRRRGQQAPAPPVPRAVGASRSGEGVTVTNNKGTIIAALTLAASVATGYAYQSGQAWPPPLQPVDNDAPVLSPAESMKKIVLPPGYPSRARRQRADDPGAGRDRLGSRRPLVGRSRCSATWKTCRRPPRCSRPAASACSKTPNNDGKMDKRTVFLDKLVLPRALKVLDHGVLVAEPPNLWLVKDTNGDLKPTRRSSVTDTYGQREANVEHNANCLTLGARQLDAHVRGRHLSPLQGRQVRGAEDAGARAVGRGAGRCRPHLPQHQRVGAVRRPRPDAVLQRATRTCCARAAATNRSTATTTTSTPLADAPDARRQPRLSGRRAAAGRHARRVHVGRAPHGLPRRSAARRAVRQRLRRRARRQSRQPHHRERRRHDAARRRRPTRRGEFLASTDERFRPVYLSSRARRHALRRRHVSRHHPAQGLHHRVPARSDPVAQARTADRLRPHLSRRARHDRARPTAGAVEGDAARSWSRRSRIRTAGGAIRRSACWSSAATRPWSRR